MYFGVIKKEKKENGCRQVDPLVWCVLGQVQKKTKKKVTHRSATKLFVVLLT